MSRSLPVLQNEPASSLNKDGSRNFVHPADVSGRFTRIRNVVFVVLLLIYLALPFVQIGGRPAVFLDIASRRFFLFGGSFNAQDFWLVFFLLTGLAFALIVVTTLWGRVWCGYACPQTVFLEGVYRRVERLVEGPRNARIKRNQGPWNLDKTWRKLTKHGIFILLSLFFSHFVLSYFVSLPSLLQMVQDSPAEHPQAFGWMAAMTLVLYGNFAWFREQLCLIICPYGRLQSTLTDRRTLVIGYDTLRGEPRGKKGKARERGPEVALRIAGPGDLAAPGDVGEPATTPPAERTVGDCIDCGRCVHVCPTGIDIRNGLQLECIGCAACVDACDEVMRKVGRPEGLVRYDSQTRFDDPTTPRRVLRPRLAIYAAILMLWAVGLVIALRSHTSYAANLLRPQGGTPFIVDDGFVRNTVQVHLVNKGDRETRYLVSAVEDAAVPFEYVLPMPEVTLGGGGDRHVPVLVRLPSAEMRRGLQVRIRVQPADAPDEARELQAPFLGPTPSL
ncbi:MAG: 4Fe-4S binding protein [Myxococcales bacterium]|nr:4Fe-4S binding protein [Myxococcales bacterium]